MRTAALAGLALTAASLAPSPLPQRRPAAGDARDTFPASGVQLASWLTGADLRGEPTNANDIWGYTSPAGREYALVGLVSGTAVVEVTDPHEPRVVAHVPGPESDWRDIATWDRYAYVVNEAGGGVQILDLRAIDRGRVRVAGSYEGGGLSTAHNVFVNADSATAYVLGANLGRGGLVMLDLSKPRAPRMTPGQWQVAYVHDVFVTTYTRGRNAGREIAFAFTGPLGLHVVDVTDKAAPVTLAHLPYANATYGHSGWLDRRKRFLYVNDELDERLNPAVRRMTTYVVRVTDLTAPKLVRAVRWPIAAIDHNSMVRGDRLFLAAYRGGLRVIDISRPKKPRQVGYFDTYPEDDTTGFSGAWGVYAAFSSGTVVVSDIERGLFVLLPR